MMICKETDYTFIIDSSKFYNLRNYVYSQASDMHLYQILVDQGYDAFRQAVLDIVIPG